MSILRSSSRRLLAVSLGLALLLAACVSPEPGGPGPAATPTGPPATPGSQPTPVPTVPGHTTNPAVQAALLDLARQLQLDPSQIRVARVEPVTWPDSCLGDNRLDRVCLQVITPGFRVQLDASGQRYTYHTNSDGSALAYIGLTGPAGTPVTASPETIPAALAARELLAQQLHLDQAAIAFVALDKLDWPSGCLGIELPDRACTEAIVPGYRVVLAAEGNEYTFHTDEAGGDVRLAQAPAPVIADQAFTWRDEAGGCALAQIGSASVAFGLCGGAQLASRFASPERAAEFAEFVATYRSFEAQTAGGTLQFTGQGQTEAGPAEQRMLAEWARLVAQEAAAGRGGASWGLAFAWHREGGLAGFCDDVAVYATGQVTATECQGAQPRDLGTRRLTAVELAQLYGWIDRLQPFELDTTGKLGPDEIGVRLVFSGAGSTPASAADQQVIQDFAAELLAGFAQ